MFAKTASYLRNTPLKMKFSRSAIRRKTHRIPSLRFEDQQLSSNAGLILFQQLFDHLELKQRMRKCFHHLHARTIFGLTTIVLCMVVHLLLGYRELRQQRYYRDDPMVLRLLGLSRLPDVATISRQLATIDSEAVGRLETLIQTMVLDRLQVLRLKRVTVDFDGSVIGTGRFAEGTAIGFNRKKKGQRSYYPLFATVAQSGQVLAVRHRSGNVHDSNGAGEFIMACIGAVRDALPQATIECRMDAAFFSDELMSSLDQAGVEYTISVPFARLPALKEQIEERVRWHRLDAEYSYFENHWQPKAWVAPRRFVMVRRRDKIQFKQPVQLDFFIPYEYGYTFKAIVTNKKLSARRLISYHDGRGSQEAIFAELKSQLHMDYVPTRRWHGNQTYLLSAVMAHNLMRDLQMLAWAPSRGTLAKRPPLWAFEHSQSIRRRLVQRAGRLIRPQGKLTLSMSANQAVRDELLHCLDALDRAA